MAEWSKLRKSGFRSVGKIEDRRSQGPTRIALKKVRRKVPNQSLDPSQNDTWDPNDPSAQRPPNSVTSRMSMKPVTSPKLKYDKVPKYGDLREIHKGLFNNWFKKK